MFGVTNQFIFDLLNLSYEGDISLGKKSKNIVIEDSNKNIKYTLEEKSVINPDFGVIENLYFETWCRLSDNYVLLIKTPTIDEY